MKLTGATRGEPILRTVRKTFVFLALLALALPVAVLASSRAGEGTLTVENGRGKVNVQARGGIIGRVDRGSVTIYDTTPEDDNIPVVTGDDHLILVGENGIRYSGSGLRFRVVGGGFRVLTQGRGIDLSVVGKGMGFIEGEEPQAGLYSLDGADCRKSKSSCNPLPEPGIRFRLEARATGN